jgi:hypothetical protein
MIPVQVQIFAPVGGRRERFIVERVKTERVEVQVEVDSLLWNESKTPASASVALLTYSAEPEALSARS